MSAERMVSFILLFVLNSASGWCQEASLFDELEIIYPDTDAAQGAPELSTDTPCNVPAGAHVLVSHLKPNASLNWKLFLNDRFSREGCAYQLIPVPVEQNTGLVNRTEVWDKKKNPHVVRRAPFQIFEVLQPVGKTITSDRNGVLAFRLEVFIPRETKPGVKNFKLQLISGKWERSLTWKVIVHPVNTPDPSKKSPGYTNWFSPSVIAQRHELESWSKPFFDMLGKYADLMKRGRQNTFWIRWTDFSTKSSQGLITLDHQRLKRYVNIFLNRGFTRVEGGHIAWRHKGDWSSPRLNLSFTGSDANSQKGRKELAQIFSAIKGALKKTGLLEKAEYLQHISDEPTDINAEAYKKLAAQVREHMPQVRIFEATMSQALVGAVDHWCPQIQKFQQNRTFFDERKAEGNRVWVYTCLAPGGPWLNRLLDQERLRPVYLGWSLAKYDLEGFLHWGFNHYRKGVDPFKTSVVPHGNGPPNFLPAGDSHVVYPGDNGPLSGQRFEAHRIGMEDAELLNSLKSKNPEAAEAVINLVLQSFDKYDKNIKAYRNAKKQLLLKLVEVQRAPQK